MLKFINDIITEADNQTIDGVRIMAFVAITNAICLSVVAVYHTGSFDLVNYGTGMGALFGGLGIALGLKKESQNDSASTN